MNDRQKGQGEKTENTNGKKVFDRLLAKVTNYQPPADYIDLGSIPSRHANLKTGEW